MIDIETLSVKNNAVIIAIAAIKFNNFNISTIEETNQFYKKIDIDSCLKLKMDVDQKTVEWWQKQNKKVFDEVFGSPKEDIKIVLEQLSKWIGEYDIIWAHSCTFDINILETAFNLCGIKIPWKFWNIRDTRTVFDITNINYRKIAKSDNLYNPLYDCFNQIRGLKESFKKLKSLN